MVRNAWNALLKEWLPLDSSRVLDAGCGTGSLGLLMAELGHDVTGIDFSEAMIAKAATKAVPVESRIRFAVMNAEVPEFAGDSFDVVLGRHVLWTFQHPATVLAAWSRCLTSPSRMILIEGFWHTGSGMHLQQVVEALPARATVVTTMRLDDQQDLWGGSVHDERFIVVADLD